MPEPEPTYTLTVQKTSEGYLAKAHPSGIGSILTRVFLTWNEFKSSVARFIPEQDFRTLYAELENASYGISFPPHGLVTLSVVQALGFESSSQSPKS
jgi:hypothetical protein